MDGHRAGLPGSAMEVVSTLVGTGLVEVLLRCSGFEKTAEEDVAGTNPRVCVMIRSLEIRSQCDDNEFGSDQKGGTRVQAKIRP